MTTSIQLAYCEIDHLVLYPNTQYVFVVIEGCAKCQERVDKYLDENDKVALNLK